MSTLAVSGGVGIGLAASQADALSSSSTEGMQNSSSAAVASDADSNSSSNSYVLPPPSFWQRVRKVWIPTSQQALADAEQACFASLRFPHESRLVPIDPPEVMSDDKAAWYINTLTLRNPSLEAASSSSDSASSSSPAPLVLLHGFGAGIGMWLSNLNHLASEYPRVDAIDMPGWGRSARVDFDKYLKRRIKAAKLRSKGDNDIEYKRAVAQFAADFTVDALESWRQRMGHERIVLLGHSMGGYLSAAYALRHPDRVESLILASPIGVPHPKPLDTSRWSWKARQTIAAFRWAWWKGGITPQSIVRALGRWGPNPVTGYVTHRFVEGDEEPAEVRRRRAEEARNGGGNKAPDSARANNSVAAPPSATTSPTPSPDSSSSDSSSASASSVAASGGGPAVEVEDSLTAARKLADAAAEGAPAGAKFDKRVVAEYLYHVCAQPGSGEFAFARLFDESGFAHNPLIDPLPSICAPVQAVGSSTAPASAQPSSSAQPHQPIPVTFLYGQSDWMDASAGAALVDRIRAAGGRAQLLTVERAGHQLMIDNPRDFFSKVKQATDFAQRRGRPEQHN